MRPIAYGAQGNAVALAVLYLSDVTGFADILLGVEDLGSVLLCSVQHSIDIGHVELDDGSVLRRDVDIALGKSAACYRLAVGAREERHCVSVDCFPHQLVTQDGFVEANSAIKVNDGYFEMINRVAQFGLSRLYYFISASGDRQLAASYEGQKNSGEVDFQVTAPVAGLHHRECAEPSRLR
jgi:hypothetical protein